MKVTVDADVCVGTGSCEALCPEVFELTDEGISKVKVDTVPEEHEDAVQEAMEACPVDAIQEV